MTDQLLRRPSTLVVLCATVVITSFVAKGDLRIETDASKRAARATSSAVEPRAEIVRASAPAPRRAVELARLSGRVLDARLRDLVLEKHPLAAGDAALEGGAG